MQNKYRIGKIRTDNCAKIIAIAEMEFAEYGYKGWIGAEYIPVGHTERGLGWIKQYI